MAACIPVVACVWWLAVCNGCLYWVVACVRWLPVFGGCLFQSWPVLSSCLCSMVACARRLPGSMVACFNRCLCSMAACMQWLPVFKWLPVLGGGLYSMVACFNGCLKSMVSNGVKNNRWGFFAGMIFKPPPWNSAKLNQLRFLFFANLTCGSFRCGRSCNRSHTVPQQGRSMPHHGRGCSGRAAAADMVIAARNVFAM